MPNDFNKREPSKTEKVLYELYMQQQGMERSLFTNSSLLIALAMNSNIKPEELAGMLVNDNEKLKDYSKKVNEAIEKLEKEKHPEHGHDHGGHEHHEHAEKESGQEKQAE
jgi:hypothetical protein